VRFSADREYTFDQGACGAGLEVLEFTGEFLDEFLDEFLCFEDGEGGTSMLMSTGVWLILPLSSAMDGRNLVDGPFAFCGSLAVEVGRTWAPIIFAETRNVGFSCSSKTDDKSKEREDRRL